MMLKVDFHCELLKNVAIFKDSVDFCSTSKEVETVATATEKKFLIPKSREIILQKSFSILRYGILKNKKRKTSTRLYF